MYQVTSGIGKRALTLWVAVCFLLGTSGCLPLDHTCLDNVTAGLRIRVRQADTPGWCGPVLSGHATVIEAKAEGASSSGHDACLACVWAHSLLDEYSAVASGIPNDTGTACWRSPETFAAGSEHFQAPFKRGPPPSAA